ncbi:hypothetical protein [Nonomuraea phyllanthi]|uniref:hypothetical protein n=1 Tax=Nonomuraea phyllanthi TaxID=2219224 RepID=UPI00186B52B9|nr:hypothetical protein [Nonomuraea phyllanthi]
MVQTLQIISYLTLAAMAIVLVVGVIVTAMGRRNHGSAALIGMGGCILLLLGVVFNVLRSFLTDPLADAIGIGASFTILSLISLLFEVGGTGLLIWGVVARRTPRGPAQPSQGAQAPGWQQPQPNWQQPQPQPPYQQPQQQPYQQQPGWQTPPPPPQGGGQS